MKLIFSFILFLLAINNSLSQQQQSYVYIDESGKRIKSEKFQKKWRNKDLMLSRWDSLDKKDVRYATLKMNLYMKGNIDHKDILSYLYNSYGITIDSSSTILLKFNFKDDLCSSRWENKWTKLDEVDCKEYTSSVFEELKKENIFFITLYDEEIKLLNCEYRKNNYNLSDINGYFRKLIFKNETLCGSFALIKPNGETLIRNGEYSADFMAQHLKPENWEKFFNN